MTHVRGRILGRLKILGLKLYSELPKGQNFTIKKLS